ncbi:phage GP46 family protein [Robbsia andropogonis]|uniref:phage GP46 family protein n=1 Tax=Robbsia andropogonis TaxID=28092 RepID=UPI003D1F46CC
MANAVYVRLKTPLGSYWADTSIGSLLYTLAREKDVPRIRDLAVQYAQQALQPLIDDGRATSITVSSASGQTGWLVMLIEVIEASGSNSNLQYFVEVL